MKEKIKRLSVLALVFVMMFSAVQIVKASETEVQTAGSSGNELNMQLYSDSEKEYSKHGPFYYEIINGEVTIVSCDEEAVGEIVIPAEIEGYPVTVLADDSFYYCYKISKLTIPSTVTTIGSYAFGCGYDYEAGRAFESIFIPASVTSIGYNAFFECSYLKMINVDENNPCYSSDEYGVLFNKDKSTLIRYPIACEQKNYAVPETVKRIEYCAFQHAVVEYVSIPESVSEIARDSFFTRLKGVSVDSDNQHFSNDEFGVLFDKNKTKLIRYPALSSETSYKVPESVSELEVCAFSNAENLVSVDLADNIRGIDYCTFNNCTNLKNITLPKNLRIINDYGAFCGCSSLERFIVPYGVVRVDYYAFNRCEKLEYVHLTEDVTYIGKNILEGTHAYICSATEDCYAKEYAEENGYEFRICDGHGLVKPESTTYPDVTVTSPSTDPSEPDNSEINPDNESTTKPVTNPHENEHNGLMISIRIPSETVIRYGDSIILYANTACSLPAGTKIVWAANNGKFEIEEVSKDGRYCKITPKSSGTTTFTVSLVDANGNVIDTDTQDMTSKANCFYKLIALLKMLLGLTKTIPQYFRGAF